MTAPDDSIEHPGEIDSFPDMREQQELSTFVRAECTALQGSRLGRLPKNQPSRVYVKVQVLASLANCLRAQQLISLYYDVPPLLPPLLPLWSYALSHPGD